MHSRGERADLMLETPQGSQGALEHLCGGVLLSEMAAITSDPKGSLRSLPTPQNCPPVVIQTHCSAVTHRVVSGPDQSTTHRGKSECLPCSHLCSPREAGSCPHLLCVPLSSIRPPCLAAKPHASLLETSSPPASWNRALHQSRTCRDQSPRFLQKPQGLPLTLGDVGLWPPARLPLSDTEQAEPR